MFIQAYGKNKKGDAKSFIAYSPENLLSIMKKEKLSQCMIEPNDADDPVMEFYTVTVDDVKEWIETGLLKGDKK